MRRIAPRLGVVLGVVLALAIAGSHARAQQGPMVDATDGSVGIGGNVTNSVINIGIPTDKLEEIRKDFRDLNESQREAYKELSESHREAYAQLKANLGLTQSQMSSALEIAGEANVPPERLGAKLVEIAEKYRDLKLAAAVQPNDDATITALKVETQKAIQDGRLGKADELLTAIERAQTEALDRLALNAAQTTAQRGDVALGRLRYADAAQRFSEAAAKLPPGNRDERWKYLNAEATALFKQGLDFGDNAAALSSVARYRALLELHPRNAFPDDWATTQNNLGVAMRVLGQSWDSGTARFEEAVSAHRLALQEFTRERASPQWAATENYLGFALFRLGTRTRGTEALEEAVAAYRDALQEFTRERAPLRWAGTTKNLGLALTALGERQRGTAQLTEAVATLQEALQESSRERAPLQWAQIQNNLGFALKYLGERENETALLEQSVAAFRDAQQEQTRQRAPLPWAENQCGIAQVFQAIGQRETGTARLEQAVAAYREALQEQTRERVPMLWAESTASQGVALALLAGRRRDVEMANLAVQQIETAVTTLRDGGNARSAAFYETRLSTARALVDRLAKP